MAMRTPSNSGPARRAMPIALIVLGIAALLAAAGLVGAAQFSAGDTGATRGNADTGSSGFVLQRSDPPAASLPSRTRKTPCHPSAHVRRGVTLLRAPGGRHRVRLSARTEWGSPRILGVVKQRRGWLGVQAAELQNGEVGWIRRSRATLLCSRWALRVDLSKRRLIARKDGKTVRKLTVAVGRSDNPTPRGRFTVTDKIKMTDLSSPYGCCVLALTGHQTNLPLGWPGGDRLAVHATSDESSIGQPISSGCMRAKQHQARWLIQTIPIGAPIFISA
jgi:hypothetical protein